MAPGHKTTEAIGFAILALLLVMVPVFVGVIAFFVKINRKAKAFAAAEQEQALA
jgi:cbb3-type cytochrome oxidase subunit 3